MIRLAIALTLAGLPAAAQGNCGPRDAVLAHLAAKYGETRQSIGMAANGQVMEVFANTDSGSWTVTVTTPQGMICMLASGEGFEHAPQEPAPQGEPG